MLTDELLRDVAARLKEHEEPMRRQLASGRLQGRKLGRTRAGRRIPASALGRFLILRPEGGER